MIEGPSGSPAAYPLASDLVTIGRVDAQRIVLDDKRTSRTHIQIALLRGRWVLRDLNSKNGTQVNGRRISSHVLTVGDVIQIGSTRLRFEPATADSRAWRVTDETLTRDAVACGPNAPSVMSNQLHALQRLAEASARIDGELSVLTEFSKLLVEVTGAEEVSLFIFEEGTERPILQVTEPKIRELEPTETAGGTREAIADQMVEVARSVDEPVRIVASPATGDSAVSVDLFGHCLFVPLRVEGRRVGMIAAQRDANATPFAEDDLSLASIAGIQIAIFLRSAL
ncbi:FHA domain-containing protein [Planctomycetota bacterium]